MNYMSGLSERVDSGTCLQVFFVDYGNTEAVDVSELFDLPMSFLKHPFQVLCASLYPVSPPDNTFAFAFFVAGPAIWNWLPDSMRDPAISRDSFRRSLKTFLFSAYLCT